MIERARRDVLYALRSLSHARALATTAVLTLGLGIGMAVAMFGVLDAVLLRSLPVRDQDHIVVLRTLDQGGRAIAVARSEVQQLHSESRTLRDVAGIVHGGARGHPMTDGDRSLPLNEALVTGNFFDVLGARPHLGRLLRSEDDIAGAPHVMVISYNAWRRDFGGDSSIVGHSLTEPYLQWSYTIVGVTPPGLDYPTGVDGWIPVTPVMPAPATQVLDVVARLAAGVQQPATGTEFLSLMRQLDSQREVPVHLAGAEVRTLTQEVVGNVKPVLMALSAAVVLILLIACSNVANLLLLRATMRDHEFAVRRALGASAGDVARQLLAESGLLAAGGGALGIVLAVTLLHILLALAPAQLPRIDTIRLAGTPVGAAIGVTFLTMLLCGVLPSLLSARGDPATPLRLDARSGIQSRRRRRVRSWLVASQVALAMVTLAAAGLVGRSLERLERIDLGYTPEHLSILQLALPIAKYNSGPMTMDAMFAEVGPRLQATPGVTALTPILLPPFLGANVWLSSLEVEGHAPAPAGQGLLIADEVGGPEYFQTFGISLIRGRSFLDTDRENAPKVVVVSQAAGRRLWPGQDPIGKRVRVLGEPDSSEWRTVVGVSEDIHFRSFREVTPTIFFPWRQFYWQGAFALRSTTDLAAVLPVLRRALLDVAPDVTIWRAMTMDQLLAGPLSQPRMSALLLSVFGLVALLLTAVGLYGVMASAVRERTQELGVRAALGATPERLRRDVLLQALTLSSIGAIVGIAGAVAISRLLTSLLFQVSPTDPVALLGACGLLLCVALVAAYVPARRATQIDPVLALRAE